MTYVQGIDMKESESIHGSPDALLHATLAPLLEPVPGAAPGGPNLENDHEFMAFETDAQGIPERSIGEDVLPPQPPNWVEIQGRAENLLTRSKDLRVALIYMQAVIARNGLAGCEAGLHLLRELVVRFWDTLHPELRASANAPGEFDASFRCNALSALCGPAFLRTVRDLPLVQMRGPVPTVREIERAEHDELPASTQDQYRKQLDTAMREQRAGLEVALRLPGAVSALEKALQERCVDPPAPCFEQLAQIAEALAGAVGHAFAREATKAAATATEALDAAISPPEENGGGGAPAAPRGAHLVTGKLNSRADAIALLDAVSAFLEQSEPAHPAPLLIRRASALLGMDFLGVMRELVPDALNQVRAIAGIGAGRN